ncbi:DUF4956 domain-containing protein [[Clostridium] symbiosum]|uniref:DUF4956 domain-containing protein n=1 Tax=Clostridium symbiosum TaxID=1512 RepID=UPI001D0782D4|nr:DUF4956 domain-containing protein [[Clostridium] symbiosum]MCB6610830.1 DUF4956 domain-containing protein [[Clostridium] symbiosum]MCB6929074.1 DUF4956 domain-containing protein [[Clostridium] symbiosum]
MNEDLLYYITNHAGSLSVQELLINFFSALVIGFIIFLSYRFSHSGAVYNARFNVSLWMLTIVTTMVMCVIGNNIALSLGMVGALSIVRFRTAIKDTRDTAYIFWCIAVGICCGISDFVTASIGSVIIFLLMLAIGGVRSNTRYLLIVRGQSDMAGEVENMIQEPLKGKARLCVKNQGRESMEYIYELSEKQVKIWQDGKVSQKLLEQKGVMEVNLVGQNDEISA